jgi:hypothetical protein
MVFAFERSVLVLVLVFEKSVLVLEGLVLVLVLEKVRTCPALAWSAHGKLSTSTTCLCLSFIFPCLVCPWQAIYFHSMPVPVVHFLQPGLPRLCQARKLRPVPIPGRQAQQPALSSGSSTGSSEFEIE